MASRLLKLGPTLAPIPKSPTTVVATYISSYLQAAKLVLIQETLYFSQENLGSQTPLLLHSYESRLNRIHQFESSFTFCHQSYSSILYPGIIHSPQPIIALSISSLTQFVILFVFLLPLYHKLFCSVVFRVLFSLFLQFSM